MILGAIVLLLLPMPSWAQASDAAYCVVLGELAIRYTGSPSAEGGTRPSSATVGAIENCSKGNTAAGIKVLEQVLRRHGITLPSRTAPA
jgi:hypothetical protein